MMTQIKHTDYKTHNPEFKKRILEPEQNFKNLEQNKNLKQNLEQNLQKNLEQNLEENQNFIYRIVKQKIPKPESLNCRLHNQY